MPEPVKIIVNNAPQPVRTIVVTERVMESSGGGSGDVTGPASAVSGNFAAFDGTTGKLIEDSGYDASDFMAAGAAPTAHASSHVTGGTDKIRDATASQDGLATAAQITKLDGIETNADVTDAVNVGAAIHGSASKTTPVDADTIALIDSAASNVLKKLSWANIKATLKSYFDTLYPSGSGSSSGTNTGDQNLFQTIAVSGQSNVVADTTSDTLTLVAGSNITITTNASTDSITIAASGGGGSGDVTGPASSTDNALARYDGTTGKIIQNSTATLSDTGTLVTTRYNTSGPWLGASNNDYGVFMVSDAGFFVESASNNITRTNSSIGFLVSPTRWIGFGDADISILNVGWKSGSGSPEGVLSANVGSFYSRTDGGANTTIYRKESGTGNTGWVAVTNSGAGITIDDSAFEVISGSNIQDALASSDLAMLNARSTGIRWGGNLTINISGTTVDVSEGAGQILDNTNAETPTFSEVSWSDFTNVTVTTTPGLTWWYIDSAGSLQQQTTSPTPDERRTKIFLGRTSWTGMGISGISRFPDPVQQEIHSVHDLAAAIGPIRVSGGAPTFSGSNLKLKISAGETFDFGTNWPDYTSPHIVATAAFDSGVSSVFRYATSSGIIATDVTDIDVDSYQVAGIVTTIPGASTRVGIHYIFGFPGGNIRLVYGLNYYSTITEARDALNRVDPYSAAPTTFLNNSFVLGAVLATKGATNLSDANQALFITTNKFGGFGGSTGQAPTGYLVAANNLSDLTDASVARTNLGGVATLTGSETLINKTITTPTISGAITFPDDVRQTFNPGATNSGLNVGSHAGDPSSPSNGDIWYDSTANELTARINGANVALGAGGGGVNSRVWAHKNGTNQTVSFTAGTAVQVTFGTEVLDTDGRFASSTLTVNSNEVWLLSGTVSVAALNNGQMHSLQVFNGGSLYRKLAQVGSWSPDNVILKIDTIIMEAGTYDVRVAIGSTVSRDIVGTTTETYFLAERLR